MCPHLQQDYICCDERQYAEFEAGFQLLEEFVGTCRACVENFRTYLCATTCGSLQSAYMAVRDTTVTQRVDEQGNPIKGEFTTVVNQTSVNVSSAVAEAIWDSCRGVKNPSTGLSVIALLGQGIVDAPTFMQIAISGDHSPVKNVFHYVDDDSTALTLHNIGREMFSCANASSGYGCSCNDCPQGCNRCPAPPQYNDSSLVPDGVWSAFGYNYLDPVGYGMAVGFLCYLATVVLAGLGGQWVSGGRLLLAQSSAKARRWLWWSGLCVLAVLVVYVVSLLWMWLAQQVSITRGDESGLVNVLSSWLHPAYFVFLLGSFIALVLAIWFFLWRYLRAYPYSFQYEPLGDPTSAHDSHLAGAAGDASDDLHQSTLLYRYASIVVAYPWLVIAGGILLTAVCGLGLLKAQLQSDPIALWVSPNSQVLQDKEYFDATFGPFYRTEQLIFTPHTASNSSQVSSTSSPVLNRRTMLMLQQLTGTIRSLSVSYNGSDVSLSTLCYRPIPGQDCVVESVLEYFSRNNASIYGSPAPTLSDNTTTDSVVRQWVAGCASQYVTTSCRGSIGAPTFPWVVLGGYNGSEYDTAAALIVTFPLNNAPDNVERAKAWEDKLLQLLASDDVQTMVQQAGLDMAYMSERSVEDEITRGTYKDIDIIILSYALMLLYISCALSSGHWGSPASSSSSRWTFPIHTKFLLGLSALLIVICSLVVSVGVVSVLGLAVTPIISEVIPFLVLAIGIDNVFLLSQSFARTSALLPAATRLTLTLQEVGTGIALAAASECGAFLLGASTDIPAVQVFAAMSAVAIAVGWLLQMSVFCAVLVLDSRRMEQGRWDVLFCVQDKQVEEDVEQWKAEQEELDAPAQPHLQQQSVQPSDATTSATSKARSSPFAAESYLQQFFRRMYLPFLFHPVVRVLVILFFPLLFFLLFSYGLSHLQLGLDQSTVIPNDSYLQAYFASEAQYLNVGPPVYFVIQNGSSNPSSNTSSLSTYNYSDYAFQDRVCSMSGSADNSVEGLISAAACTPGSYIAQSPSSWMDAYMIWLGSTLTAFGKTVPVCCAYNPSFPDQLCQIDGGSFDDGCVPCVPPAELTYAPQRPPPASFERWLQLWLTDSTCGDSCAFCSAGLYDDIAYTTTTSPASNVTMSHVYASRYMTYHTPLRNQSDFIAAIKSAHELSDRISQQQQLDVFPYSVIYVYFQQYLDIQHVAILNIGLAFVAILVLSLLLLRCFWIAVLQTLTIAMIVGDLIGGMAVWGVYLNALSVLNIIMCVGISVEFCIHISTRFLFTRHSSRTQRAAHAMYTVGVSVAEGITLTKVTGVLVLAAASSQVFDIYYFRMYLLIVLLGVAHGCVWLPVVLSLVGSRTQTTQGGLWGGWMWGWPWQGLEDNGDVWEEEEGEEEGEEEEEEGEDFEGEAEVAEYEATKRKLERLTASVDEKERALLDEEVSVRRDMRKSRHR